MSRGHLDLFDPSSKPVVEELRLRIQRSFPTEKGLWTPFLEVIFYNLTGHFTKRNAAFLMNSVLESTIERDLETLKIDNPSCTYLREALMEEVASLEAVYLDRDCRAVRESIEQMIQMSISAWTSPPVCPDCHIEKWTAVVDFPDDCELYCECPSIKVIHSYDDNGDRWDDDNYQSEDPGRDYPYDPDWEKT